MRPEFGRTQYLSHEMSVTSALARDHSAGLLFRCRGLDFEGDWIAIRVGQTQRLAHFMSERA